MLKKNQTSCEEGMDNLLIGNFDNLGRDGVSTGKYLLSAIVSTYNSEHFIRGCLEDLEAQTIADRLEIIVVNSGSEQNEEAIVKDFQKKYSNIKYIRTDQRETVYAAWNRGIKAATGKYITNANADDRHRKDAFEVMLTVLEKQSEIALVYADGIITETENETFESCTPVGYLNWMDWNRENLLNKGCFMGPQPMWRSDVHDEYGYFDDSFVTSGDYEFWLRISQTHTFLHLPIRLGLYLRSPVSIEHSNREKQRKENNKIFRMYSESHSSCKNISGATTLQQRDNITSLKKLADFFYIEQGRLEDALKIYLDIIAKDPKNLENLLIIGHICVSLQNFDNAKIFYNRVLEIEPWNKDARQNLDKIVNSRLPKISSHDAGSNIKNNTISDLNKFEAQSFEEIYQSAQSLINEEKFDKAIIKLEQLLKAHPGFSLAHNDLGVLYYRKKDKNKALFHYQQAEKLMPGNTTFKKNLTDFYFVELGKIEEALKIYIDVLRLNPEDVETLLITGHICVSLKEFEDAKVFYTRVLNIEPFNIEAKDNLEKIDRFCMADESDDKKNAKGSRR